MKKKARKKRRPKVSSPNKKKKKKPRKRDVLLTEDGGKFGEGSQIYRTTLLDRIFSKATFEMLDVVSNFSIHENTIFSRDGYSRVYNILKYPPKIYYTDSRGYISVILDNLSQLDNFKSQVDFYFESFNRPYRIVFDKKTENRRQGLIRLKKDLESGGFIDGDKGTKARSRDIAKYTQDINNFRLQEVEKKLNSHRIIKENQRIGKTQIESYQFIRIVCKNKDDLIEAEKTLTEHMSSYGISIRQVKDVTNYLETFSPISGQYNMNKNNIFVPTIFTSDGYPKLFNTPTRIMENELKGLSRLLYVGASVKDKEPLALTLTSSGKGQNMVIVGSTGSGKTYLYENLAMQLALHGFKINIMDYKGNEYDFLADLLPNSVKLDFSNKSSFYVNTLKFIPELYGNNDEDKKAAFSENKTATVNSLLVLSGVKGESKIRAKALLSYLIDSVFLKYEVDYDDTYSYFRTHNIPFRKAIYEQLIRLESEQVLWDRYGKDVCNDVGNALQPYFFEFSAESRMFAEEFDISDIITADAIIYSFYMNVNSPWDTTMEYKIYMQDYITNLYIRRNKELGHTTVNSIEEYQRAVLQESTKRIYNNKLSGGRSDNVINVIMTNTIAPLIQNDLDISAVRENISTKFVSNVEDMDALNHFCRIYNLGEEGRRRIIEASQLQHAFFCDYDTGVQRGSDIIKAIHPEEVSKLLETKKIDEIINS